MNRTHKIVPRTVYSYIFNGTSGTICNACRVPLTMVGFYSITNKSPYGDKYVSFYKHSKQEPLPHHLFFDEYWKLKNSVEK